MTETNRYDRYTSEIEHEILMHFEDKRVLGAMFAAASKRHISNVVMMMIAQIDADVTPILAHKLMKATWGRSVSMTTLISRFARKERTAQSKSLDFERIDELIAANKDSIRNAVEFEKMRLLEIRKSLIRVHKAKIA
jgi:hypothetical protein